MIILPNMSLPCCERWNLSTNDLKRAVKGNAFNDPVRIHLPYLAWSVPMDRDKDYVFQYIGRLQEVKNNGKAGLQKSAAGYRRPKFPDEAHR